MPVVYGVLKAGAPRAAFGILAPLARRRSAAQSDVLGDFVVANPLGRRNQIGELGRGVVRCDPRTLVA